MLTLTDVTLKRVDGGAPDAPQCQFDIQAFVCLEGAVRAVDALMRLEGPRALLHKRALLHVASSHASYVADVGAAVSAGRANEAINSSKRISCADVNTWLGTTAFDVYAGGLANQQRDFQSTPYSGTYTARVDTA